MTTGVGLARMTADTLTAAGERAVIEPRKLAPPGALVVPRSVERTAAASAQVSVAPHKGTKPLPR